MQNTPTLNIDQGRPIGLKPLVWSEELPPDGDCPYHHLEALTPFGRFFITWKGWKERGCEGISIDEAPWGEPYTQCFTLDEAKSIAEQEFREKIVACFETVSRPNEPLKETPSPQLRFSLQRLVDAGHSLEVLGNMSDLELLKTEGIGRNTLREIRVLFPITDPLRQKNA